MKTIIIISGADRVGKSTLASTMEEAGFCRVIHHGPPPLNRPLFSDLRDDIRLWLDSRDPQMVWDRAYVCSYCLYQPDVLDAILEFEWEFRDLNIRHWGLYESWNMVARRHILELEDEFPNEGNWFLRDQYLQRMESHRCYYKRLRYFYDNVTLFPHKWL